MLAEVDPSPPTECSAEDALRASIYRLFARLLTAAPSTETLVDTSRLAGDDATAFGAAINALATAAAQADAPTVETEFHDLFTGVGRGELVPYASYYLTGFLHERPLAQLRGEMARLGIQRNPDVKEPEDNIASILEVMAGLIDGTFAGGLSIGEQRTFFETHIASWAPHLFDDLAGAQSSDFYRSVAHAASEFIAIEREGFRMS
ncbi:MAG: molecular chaperone TorD family protein [Pseudomonadota bacterium]